MKKILKAYKFPIEPTEEQKVLLNKHFGSVRYVFNYFLSQRKSQYETTKKSDNYYTQAKKLTELKEVEETNWLNEINSQSLQHTLKHIENAYVNFFRGTAKFPKFKSKKNKNSFTVPQHITIEDGRLYIPKFKKGLKLNLYRELPNDCKIKSCTISKSPTNKYTVSILVEMDYIPYDKTGAVVGIDLGLKDFVITSDGVRYPNKRHFNKYQNELKQQQQHLSRKQKGSRQYENQRLKVAKVYEKITNTRLDLLHKISTDLVKNNDVICVEDLNIKGMIKHPTLSKHIQDASWGEFVRQLKYKSSWNDKELVTINRFYPSSKSCNQCGWVNESLKLNDRTWTCKNGHILDRDVNASINILKEGLRNLSVGTTDYTDGDSNKTKRKNGKSLRSQKPTVF
jgi:putative transposase